MTIRQLSISNFQSHKKTVLNFHHGVNAIVGLSDCGKSAVLRALGWVIRNKSEDRGFRSSWGGKTDVEIAFSDGNEVSRTQEKHNCYYLVDSKNNVDQEYTAFKTDIPEYIATALNMDSINIQSQFDRPFLLDESPGDVAKLLNKLANLSEIDTSISNIRKQVLANSGEIKTAQAMLDSLKEQEKSFEYLEQMEADVKELEELKEEQVEIDQDILVLTVLTNHIEKDQEELEEIKSFLKAEESLTDTLTLVDTFNTVVSQIKTLNSIVSELSEDEKELHEIKNVIEAESDTENALLLAEKLKQVQIEEGKIHCLVELINIGEGKLRTIAKNLDCWEFEFEAKMGKVCPLCDKGV